MKFPATRMRRLRHNPILRSLITETQLSLSDLVFPLFIRHGENIKKPISSTKRNRRNYRVGYFIHYVIWYS
jgi:porphobilinogen synthase